MQNSRSLHLGFVQSKHDYSLFVKVTNSSLLVVLVYVDDIMITGTNLEEITAL